MGYLVRGELLRLPIDGLFAAYTQPVGRARAHASPHVRGPFETPPHGRLCGPCGPAAWPMAWA